MVSLADIRARNVQPVWQEAVAVVQELIQSSTTSGTPLPDLEHVALIPNGDVVAMPGSPESADPVRQAATMLRVLVDGTATPPELEEFMRKNLSSAAAPTLEDFARGLSFYERPGRRSDVERLVSRATAAEQVTRADEELRKLKVKAAEASDSRLEDTVFMDTVAMSGRRRQPVVAIAGVALLVVVVGGVWWWWRDRARAPQASASAAATSNPPAAATADKPASNSAAGAATVDKTVGKTAGRHHDEPGGRTIAPALLSTTAPSAGAATRSPVAAGLHPRDISRRSGRVAPASPRRSAVSRARDESRPCSGGLCSRDSPWRHGSRCARDRGLRSVHLFDRAKAAVQSAVNSSSVPPAPSMRPCHRRRRPSPLRRRKCTTRDRSRCLRRCGRRAGSGRGRRARARGFVGAVRAAARRSACRAGRNDLHPRRRGGYSAGARAPGAAEGFASRSARRSDWQHRSSRGRAGRRRTGEALLSANRFHERMLMSAAKMWKFRPAFKDGIPSAIAPGSASPCDVVGPRTRSTWQTRETWPTRRTY